MWQRAREGYEEGEPSQVPITNDMINAYWSDIKKVYDLSSIEGVNEYIEDKLIDFEDEEFTDEEIEEIHEIATAIKEGRMETYTLDEMFDKIDAEEAHELAN